MSVETQAPAQASAASPSAKRSAVEGMKETSRLLRGSIADELRSCDHFNEQNKNLIKFHGSYQQEDRDARKSRRKEGVGKYYMFMVRCKIPGGKLTADQYLAMDQIAGALANGTLRFTTRQGIQLHGVVMTNLKQTIANINACLLTTLGACGDVERNVMTCPAPHGAAVHAELQETAALLAAQLAPRSRAYHEIWLNGEPVDEHRDERDSEPLYGKTYLPRKFKTGLGLPEDNCIDIYAQDLGLLAIVESGTIVGYNVLVGGGMGMTHGNQATFPHLARPICYVPARAVVGAAEAVIKLFRDHGNRADRKRARIKYLVHDWGVPKFREILGDYLGGALLEPKPVRVSAVDPHLGWHPQGQGKFFYGLSVENGRVKDEGPFRLRSCLRALVERFRPGLRITPMQDILLCDLDEQAWPQLERTLAEFGVERSEKLSMVQRLSMACPAIPTCGLAISESERALPRLIDELEAQLKRLGLENEKIAVRMTGCPNGCARPYQSDIGLVGRSGDKYTVFVGGRLLGDRLSFQLKDLVPLAQIVPLLVPLLEKFRQDRQTGEVFGDFCQRLGEQELLSLLEPRVGQPPGPIKEATQTPAAVVNGQAPEPTPADDQKAPGDARLPADDSQAGHARPLPIRCETFFAGQAGEELADFAYRYHADGSVRETVVFFYGDDQRAGHAQRGQPLRREAVYLGQANPYRLHACRKLSDTHLIGPAGQELRDRRVEYYPDGRLAQTVVFYYDGDCRAAEAASGASLRRQLCVEGTV